ncbi:hypothetical protein BC332_30689 [Capsicum chinense]|nr:hypothetical protein BC332_30689 [Capsicum chinense]
MSAGKARWADLVEEVLNPPHTKSRAPKTAENTWSEIDSAVIFYVMGSNPPQSVMEGHFNRVWKGKGVERVAQVNRGVFLVRFGSKEEKLKVIEEGILMFDRKPIVVKACTPEVELTKEK